MKKKKAITVSGTARNFATFLKMTDKLFDAIFISFYEPWIREDGVDIKKLLDLTKKLRKPTIKLFKILWRSIKLYKIIKSYNPDIIITHHDESNISIIPLLLFHKYILKSNVVFIDLYMQELHSTKKVFIIK